MIGNVIDNRFSFDIDSFFDGIVLTNIEKRCK